MNKVSSASHKDAAVDFLKMIVAGKIDEAYSKYVDMSGKHHNVFFPSGFASLQSAMKENQSQMPDKELTVKNVIGDADIVVVHSHLTFHRGEDGMAVVHILRFKNDRIVELWDCGQAIPKDSPNNDGPF